MVKRIKTQLMNATDLSRTITRLAHEVLEQNKGVENLAIIGVPTRGAHLAKRLAGKISEIENKTVPCGKLDVTLYRDDFKFKQPIVHISDISFNLDKMTLVLIDDVLYTGRTIRAAMDALVDFGRPARILLAVLIDRGHRELPIRPDFVGKNVPTSPDEEIRVKMSEEDEEDAVYLVEVEQQSY